MAEREDVARAIRGVVREHHRWVLARLVRVVRDLDLAEDALQSALEAALAQWAEDGIPDAPRAWLVRTARFKAIDALRHRTMRRGKAEEVGWLETLRREPTPEPEELGAEDDMLRLIFVCCHPAMGRDAQVALTLRTIAGLTTEEIARAFLVPVPTMAQRLVRAKKKIQRAGVPYRVPGRRELDERLASVLAVVYLVFNEGYTASQGATHVRTQLCDVAIDLGAELVRLFPEHGEVLGLVGLMHLQDSRRATRVDAAGDLVLLEAQDRSRWDRARIDAGVALTRSALRTGSWGGYALQAAIAAVHAEAPTAEATDWAQIVLLYDRLLERTGSAVVALNRAVAIAFARGLDEGLRALSELEEALTGYHLYWAAKADLLRRRGDFQDAAESYRAALARCENDAERRYLERRLQSVVS